MDEATDVRVMRLRYPGVCRCGAAVPAGTRAGWLAEEKRVVCPECLADASQEVIPPPGVESRAEMSVPGPIGQANLAAAAGSSLQAEYDRRMAIREAQVTGRFPRVGRLLLAIFDESPSTKAFKKGVEGERKAVEYLLANAGDEVLLLVNRRLGPGRRDGDIDVLAITAAGVHVIDVKRYKDAKVSVERTGGLFSPRVEHLMIGGRDRTSLLDSVDKQVATVQDVLARDARLTTVPVSAALCFVDAVLPMMGTPVIHGIRCLGRKSTAKWIREATGPHDQADREALYTVLDQALPPAV